METIDLFEAIRQMRVLTQEGNTFSLVHATYNRNTGSSDGKRLVRKAHLRPQARGDEVSQADHKLFYYDVDEHLARNCWQVLILFFNGMKVVLN
jgi:hypothetical protein